MTTVGSGSYTYTEVRDGPSSPRRTLGSVSAIATDSQDNVYIFNRKDPRSLCAIRRQLHQRMGMGLSSMPWLLHRPRPGLPHRPGHIHLHDLHPGRQAGEDAGPARRPLRHGLRAAHGPVRVPPARSTTPANWSRAPGRPVRFRRIPERPGAPLRRRRQPPPVLGHLGKTEPGQFHLPTASWWTRPTPSTSATGKTPGAGVHSNGVFLEMWEDIQRPMDIAEFPRGLS